MMGEVDGKQQLLDGRNRFAACFLLGLKPKTEMADPKHTKDPPTLAAYITSLNVHRRHLTPEQKATALRDLIIASPEKSGGARPSGVRTGSKALQ